MMGRKYLAWALLMLMPWLLSACTLLPQEEARRTAPLISTYTQPAYKTETVQRETLIDQKSISCKYVPLQSEGLFFAVGGEYVDEIFVQLGDTVEAGQVLAQLRLNDTEAKIEEAKRTLEETEIRLKHLDALEELALRKCMIEQEGKSERQKQEAMETVKKSYASQRLSLEDTYTIQKMTLEALEEALHKRQIIAPYAGIVTYVRKYDAGAASSLNERVITLADATLSLFRAETKYWDSFHTGDVCEITVNKEVYEAVVTDEEALGLARQEKIPGKNAYVYFKLNAPHFELEEGDMGKIELVLDTWENVLTLSEKAISSIAEKPIVYFPKEDGTITYHYIETGVTVNKRVEIISGLNEGDMVIVN